MDESHNVDYTRVATELELKPVQVQCVTELLDEGNTVPFITRYRKERTGNLDEERIRQIQQRVGMLRQLAERASTILRLIEAQGKLTPSLRKAIEGATTLKRLDDLYLPYRPKRRSRATIARERGLEPLADRIWNQDAELGSLEQAALSHVNADNDLPETADVLRGVADIVAERIGEHADVRSQARKIAWRTGQLVVTATKAAAETPHEFHNYFDYAEAVSRIPPHRILALNRGEKAGILRVKFTWDDVQAYTAACNLLSLVTHPFRSFMENCTRDALQRLIHPSLDREVRRELTERAEQHAVDVFARNLRSLLLQPPLRNQRILAIDPGFRTGCKVAALDERGNCLAIDVIYVTGSEEKRAANTKRLGELTRQHNCTVIAVGNGTACRETEEMVTRMIAEHVPEARYIIVNEAGASIYSASPVAREEFPNLDATARGTISIGRRLQDPLSELVKIDPQHIGVGLYQHDVAPKRLRESLDQVIESCVNFVGVNLNTASASLLRHVSGLNQLIARRVVDWRNQNGPFSNRQQLRKVAGIGEATLTQAAGFLKIEDGDEPLDRTWIHPECYGVTRSLLTRFNVTPDDLARAGRLKNALPVQLPDAELNSLANELDVGIPTLKDILDALARPGRDPRTDSAGPLFKTGVLTLDDLANGMELQGTVLNVVDFGAFVDIGLKDSGLVHVSAMADRYVTSPHDVVSVGDVVTVWVTGVDRDRRRVSLSMLKPDKTGDLASTSSKESQPSPVSAADAAAQSNRHGQSRRSSSGTRASKTSAASAKKRSKSRKPPTLTEEKQTGREPLRGFDELKELWKKKPD